MAGAELHDLAALGELRGALVRFRERTRGIPDQLKLRTAHAHQDLSRRRHAIQAMISELENSAADDDDESESRAREAERERELDRLRRALDRVEACESALSAADAEHERALGAWRSLMDRTLPSAIAFLSGKQAQVVDANVGLAASGAGGRFATMQPAGASHAPAGAATSFGSSNPVDAASADQLPSLPAGYVWAPISQFDRTALRGKIEFGRKGVSYDDMTGGLQRLWSELMPLLKAAPDAGRNACERFDRDNGRFDPLGGAHPASLAELWGHFFRKENHVRLEIDRSGAWSITNGQHRISAAHDLGWKFIPAEVIDMSNGAGQP